MKVLLLGSGGREHALAWKINQSPHLEQLYIAPGNAGTMQIGTNVNLGLTDFSAIKKFALDMKIDLILVGPEQPLVDGLYDSLKSEDATQSIFVVGMSKEAAQLEGSKEYAKAFMMRHNIPTAGYQSFDSSQLSQGEQFLENLQAPFVLKADGLAAGKGVLIMDNLDEAKKSLREMLLENKFGEAGQKVVIEEFLHGIELSVFILTDGNDYLILPEAKDYKRIGDGDLGPNTGGMGSISPVPFADAEFMKKVEDQIIAPTVSGLKSENLSYQGFVFIGLMNVGGNPFVIEYNVRLGDPETESVIPRIKNDLLAIFSKMKEGKLKEVKMEIDNRIAATIMMVSGGYPDKYDKGKIIRGLENNNSSLIFHAATKMNENGDTLTDGGRVLAVTSLGNTLHEATQQSYKSIQDIQFEKAYFRKDIGKDLV
jgi:phosphoribosylamine--glycine ligase